MKKNTTVNISGYNFYIEEDAYDMLDKYLKEIQAHYKDEKGADEILSDIEARIAEMLSEKISDKKQVITLTDIKEIICIMGQPYEFEKEDSTDDHNAPGDFKRPKRLFRDADDKMLGGICSGLGAYFDTDPIWFRLLFFGLIFVGGSGILIYLILWIVVPQARTTAEKLEMKGEPVNISTIEKKIREELSHIESKLNDLSEKARKAYKKGRGGQ